MCIRTGLDDILLAFLRRALKVVPLNEQIDFTHRNLLRRFEKVQQTSRLQIKRFYKKHFISSHFLIILITLNCCIRNMKAQKTIQWFGLADSKTPR